MKSPLQLSERAFGLLLHPTSLPGPHGSGDLGSAAYAFVDFLAAAGGRWWQMLPIVPPGPGNAPYSSYSAFAGSPLLISLELLARDGLLKPDDVKPSRGTRANRVAYGPVRKYRLSRLRKAFARFMDQSPRRRRLFDRFCAEQRDWLDEYALFTALKRAHGDQPWLRWPRALRLHDRAALRSARTELANDIAFEQFFQFQFDRQWTALRHYAQRQGVGLIGDIPIFVAYDSADVWAHRDLFQLDAAGRPRVVSGVPPDCFSRTGQLWGHPHYDWGQHRATRFAWWLARFRRVFTQFDAVRIDHFLGFHRVWQVSGRAKTAQRGRWVQAPGRKLFDAVQRRLGKLEIIAEDLGVVTPEAVALRDRFGFPGMRLLQFAFGGDEAHYNEPDAYPRNCVVYPGTHDNDTTVGWFRTLRSEARRKRRKSELSTLERVLRYTGTDGREIHWDMIRLSLMSVANTAIIPVQDLLGLGSKARMNFPGTATGNWEWRLSPGALDESVVNRLREMATTYNRVRGRRHR